MFRKGFNAGFGGILGAACAIGLVSLIAFKPMAVMSGFGILLLAVLLLIAILTIGKFVARLPMEAHQVIASVTMMAFGWLLAHQATHCPPIAPPVFLGFLKGFAWFLSSAGLVLLVALTTLSILDKAGVLTDEYLFFYELGKVSNDRIDTLKQWGDANPTVELRIRRSEAFVIVAAKGKGRILRTMPSLV